jgi:hypothetical protein
MWWEYYVHMYANGKIRPVEAIPEKEEWRKGDKGE